MLRCVEINEALFDIAITIQNEIFPDHDAFQNYKEAVEHITDNKYYLVQNETNGEYVGISGIYSLSIDPDSAWLGWFGILEKYRRKHYGSETLRLFEDTARSLGFKYCRFYTDKFDNDATISFYKKNGYILENYDCVTDPSCVDFPILIGSKSLDKNPPTLWNNKNIDLTSQIFKQTGFVPKQLNANNLDDVTDLYEKCFLDNKYFLEQFKGRNLKEIMDTSFRDMFKYCLNAGCSYGIFEKEKLVAFSLCFDFYELKNKNIRQFNNVFTSDYDCSEYPYQTEFHSKVNEFEKPVMYILAIAVDKNERKKGMASRLIDNVILTFKGYTIMSDVTSVALMKVFEKRKFNVSKIDEGYNLVYKKVNSV